MRISIREAEGQLTELVRLANQGEEIILTQEGQPSVRLEPVSTLIKSPIEKDEVISRLQEEVMQKKLTTREEKARLIDRLQEEVRQMNLPPGPDAAHSQDFLYDEDGLPK